jgi:outer membrane biosynthesis protein TonB
MRPAGRRRTYALISVSAAAHVAVLAALAVYMPKLRVPPPERGPPIPVLPVLILPKSPGPTAASSGRPGPIRLHRRPQPFAQTPVAPLIAPEPEPAPEPPPSPGPKAVTAPPAPEPAAAKARNVLKGLIGCSNPDAAGLTREEREKCQQRLSGAPPHEPVLSTDRTLEDDNSDLGKAARRRERDYKYKHGNAPIGVVVHPGASSQDIGRMTGTDNTELKIPF